METGSAYTFSPMEPRHGGAVGRIHAQHIAHSFMSSLGGAFLGTLYEILLETGYGFGFVALRRDEVVGFSFGRILPTPSMVRVMLGSLGRMLIPLLKLVLSRPGAVYHTAVGMRQSDALNIESGTGELLSIAVRDDAREGQAGRKILLLLFDALRERGCPKVRWATHGDNARAKAFFLKMNGRVIQETQLGGRSILWFELDLIPS